MKKKRQLLFSITKKDLDITYYKASGKGGQNRNKRETAVRIVHRDSGVTVTASEQRNQHQNLKTAFIRLTKHEDFKKWHRLECARRMNREIEMEAGINKRVDDMMKPENLKVEVLVNGK